MIKKEYSENDYWEGKVPDEKFDEYLKKYGYEYTPTDYDKIPPRYWELLLYSKDNIKFIDIRHNLCYDVNTFLLIPW